MSHDSVDVFAAQPTKPQLDDDVAPLPPPAETPRQGNRLAVAGAVLSLLPPVGLVVSGAALFAARSRNGAGRRLAVAGVALSLVLGGVAAYVASTAPLLDPGCIAADSSGTRLRAMQASPGTDLTDDATLLTAIQADLQSAAAKGRTVTVRERLDLVANDVGKVAGDMTIAAKSGDTTALLADVTTLQTDGNAADSYCHSL